MRAAMSACGSRSTYRSKAILRSTLPSGALLMAAVICRRSSPCRHSGSTTRAAATGSTEPERLRQLSGVALFRASRCTFRNFRSFCTIPIEKNRINSLIVKVSVVCSDCHDVLLYSLLSVSLIRSKKNWITTPMVSSVMAHEMNFPYLLVDRAARSI